MSERAVSKYRDQQKHAQNIDTKNQHEPKNKLTNLDDSMARRTSRINKKPDDSTARRAATLFAVM